LENELDAKVDSNSERTTVEIDAEDVDVVDQPTFETKSEDDVVDQPSFNVDTAKATETNAQNETEVSH
jgi:hypothetical protein